MKQAKDILLHRYNVNKSHIDLSLVPIIYFPSKLKNTLCILYFYFISSDRIWRKLLIILILIYKEAFYSTYKNYVDYWNVYWTVIGNLVCVLAYHGSFVLYDVIFCRHYKDILFYITQRFVLIYFYFNPESIPYSSNIEKT